MAAPFEPLWDVPPDGQQFVIGQQVGVGEREPLLVLNWEFRWRDASKNARP